MKGRCLGLNFRALLPRAGFFRGHLIGISSPILSGFLALKKAIEGALHDLATAKLQKSFEDGPGGHGIRRKSRTPNGTTMSDVIRRKREKNKPTLCFCFALCATLSKAFEGPS